MSGWLKRRSVYLIAGVVLLIAGLWIWQSGRITPLSSDSQLVDQVKIIVSNGWPWLKISDVAVIEKSRESNGWRIKFVYTLTIMRDESALPQTEIERFRRFLPMCGEVNLQTGHNCTVEETLLFILTDDYGWVPEMAVKYMPKILPQLANKLR